MTFDGERDARATHTQQLPSRVFVDAQRTPARAPHRRRRDRNLTAAARRNLLPRVSDGTCRGTAAHLPQQHYILWGRHRVR